MSVGFYRRAPRRLSALEIFEVSSVDKASNPHAKVMLLKGHGAEQMNVEPVVKLLELNFLLEKGAITNVEYCQRQTGIARMLYPAEKTDGAALRKLFESCPDVLRSAPRTTAAQMAEVYKSKKRLNDMDGGNKRPGKDSDNLDDSADGALDESADASSPLTPEQVDKGIRALQKLGHSFESAAGIMANREKLGAFGPGY